MVQDDTGLRCMAATLILVLIIDVDDSFVVLTRMTLDLYDTAANCLFIIIVRVLGPDSLSIRFSTSTIWGWTTKTPERIWLV